MATVAELRAEVAEIVTLAEAKLAALGGNDKALLDEIEALKASVVEKDAAIASKEAEFDAVKADLDALKAKFAV